MYESTITRVSDGSFREQRRVIHSEREKPRLIYMRGEPQDTNGAIQVQYERADTREYNRRGRGGEVEAGRDSRTWWHGGGLHAQRDCGPYTSRGV
jgi:hypothetical protein